MDYDRVAAEFLRALRGHRSQTAFARRLGYRSNVIYTWEAGRGWPTGSKALQAARRVGIEPRDALNRFYRGSVPAPLTRVDPASPSGVACLLRELRGRSSILELATKMDRSRFVVSRWLKGSTQPPLPDFFRLIESSSLRLLDFIASFVSPSTMPSIAPEWRALEATRAAAHDAPWSQAVLRVLELADYQRLSAHEPGFIARRIGISEEEEAACLRLLEDGEQIRWDGKRWVLHRVLTVDTRRDPLSSRRLRTWWTQVGLERLQAGRDGTFSYNVCAVSEKDLERIRALHRQFFSEVQAIVAKSEPVDRVALINTQILALDSE